MAVTVNFIGAFRTISGRDKIAIKIKGTMPLKEVVKKMIEKVPALKRALVDSELEDPRPNALILVNGKEISVLNGLETLVKDSDEIVLVPVIHGG
ncbi:MAG: MoaD/ThiS family protein [Candidatus Bathyarchaeota archaeon]|jgi:molybdopterin converting factor small subunit|nr:MoaD/ThiS family protein [Candidatus Bathyarchaeota archaeon]